MTRYILTAIALSLLLIAPADAQTATRQAAHVVSLFDTYCARGLINPAAARKALDESGFPSAPSVTAGSNIVGAVYEASDATGDVKIVLPRPGRCTIVAQRLKPDALLPLLEQTLKKNFAVRRTGQKPVPSVPRMTSTDYLLTYKGKNYAFHVFYWDQPQNPSLSIVLEDKVLPK